MKILYNKYINYLLKLYKNKNFEYVFLYTLFAFTLIYSFTLAYKRFDNFEYGKFDLGNMVQMIHNTSQGRFMELTDQFGTNMPRWGMSHVDPVLLIFVPISFIFSHPMMIVFFQHILIISAIFPIYFLFKLKLKDKFSGLLMTLIYVLYPANGFTLVWTTYHGISFVAPLLIWLMWILEQNNFFLEKAKKSKVLLIWALVIIMILGKEEIGSMIGIFGMYVIYKASTLSKITLRNINIKTLIKVEGVKHGLIMIIVGFLWTFICFFIIIPAYSDLREKSVLDFVGILDAKSANPKNAIQENFFLMRYSYLGESYSEVVINMVLKPGLWIKEIFTREKLSAVLALLGPLGFIAIFNPFWLISLPDILVVIFSKDEIFNVNNHRIAFITVTLFISYILILSYIFNKLKNNKLIILRSFLVLTLMLTIYFSSYTSNPLYVAVNSLFKEKFLSKVFASEPVKPKNYNIGFSRKSKVPRNRKDCFDFMYGLISENNPNKYTGPDYLGAHAANRYVNALFPGRYMDADMVIADVYDIKALDPLETDSWQINKDALKRMNKLSRYKHVFSCAQMNAFVIGSTKDSMVNIPKPITQTNITIESEKTVINIVDFKLPQEIDSNTTKNDNIELSAAIMSGTFKDQVNFYTFESTKNPDYHFYFIDYLTTAAEQGFDTQEYNQYKRISYNIDFITKYPKGEYNVFYGVGDLLQAREVYLGKMLIK